MHDALLDEVTALVERPNVLLCRFEPEFLAVPQECLILTMKANQKYFPLLDAQGKLPPTPPRKPAVPLEAPRGTFDAPASPARLRP